MITSLTGVKFNCMAASKVPSILLVLQSPSRQWKAELALWGYPGASSICKAWCINASCSKYGEVKNVN